jgi:5-methylcytosine-specific restriction protein A
LELESLERNIEALKKGNKVILEWTSISTKKVQIGDRAFIIKLGKDPKGIVASGYIVSRPFLAPHWKDKTKLVNRVLIDFDIILNSSSDEILDLEILKKGTLAEQHWSTESSGISIRSGVQNELEELWFKFITNKHTNQHFETDYGVQGEILLEGSRIEVRQTIYERNPYARKVCLKTHGYSCKVCKFNFEESFGAIGKEFIHVHHLKKISTIGTIHIIDPVKDLVPVCPNCHAMLHKENPPMEIEKLINIINENKNNPNLYAP